jgi:hypothetical protein
MNAVEHFQNWLTRATLRQLLDVREIHAWPPGRVWTWVELHDSTVITERLNAIVEKEIDRRSTQDLTAA